MLESFYADDHFYRQHHFDLPLNYEERDGESVRVFAREVVAKTRKTMNSRGWFIYRGDPDFHRRDPVATVAGSKEFLSNIAFYS